MKINNTSKTVWLIVIILIIAAGTAIVFSSPVIQRQLGLDAQYASFIDRELSEAEKQKFGNFINKHENEIVYIRTWADSDVLEEGKYKGSPPYSISVFSDPTCHETGCENTAYSFDMKPLKEGGSIYWANNGYVIDGFFLITPFQGMHQGGMDTGLEEQNRSEVILKMGSPPKE